MELRFTIQLQIVREEARRGECSIGRSGKDGSRIGEWWGNEVENACVSIHKMEHLPRARAVHSAYSCVDDGNLKGERCVKVWPNPPCVCAHFVTGVCRFLFSYPNK